MRRLLLMILLLGISGCAGMGGYRESVRVTVSAVEVLESTVFEQLYRITLRVQNRGEQAITIQGGSFDMAINGRDFPKTILGFEFEQVPYLLTVAWTSARNVGLETEVTSILKMVESYWIEDDDVIPDSIGIFGLLDDAYCSLLSMQTLSDMYRMQSGKHLFPDDLTAANKAMRKIIGEPYTSELDELVSKAIADAKVGEAVQWLASPEKQKLLDSEATIWNHGPVSQLPVSQLKGLGLVED